MQQNVFVAVAEVRCYTIQRNLSNLQQCVPRKPGETHYWRAGLGGRSDLQKNQRTLGNIALQVAGGVLHCATAVASRKNVKRMCAILVVCHLRPHRLELNWVWNFTIMRVCIWWMPFLSLRWSRILVCVPTHTGGTATITEELARRDRWQRIRPTRSGNCCWICR